MPDGWRQLNDFYWKPTRPHVTQLAAHNHVERSFQYWDTITHKVDFPKMHGVDQVNEKFVRRNILSTKQYPLHSSDIAWHKFKRKLADTDKIIHL